jgi:hypothetical protein
MRPDTTPNEASLVQATEPVSPPSPPRSRRAILAAAVGGLAGSLATALGRPGAVNAAAGDALKLGQQNYAGTAATRLSATSSGGAFWMTQNGFGSAVKGDSTSGHGAVFTTAHQDRYGLLAEGSQFIGTGAAIRGIGNGNDGLYASGWLAGVRGESTGGNGGEFTTAGNTAFGVRAQNTAGFFGPGAAVRGDSPHNYGVWGVSTAATGVFGSGPNGVHGEGASYGVYGSLTSADGTAVRGECNGSGEGVHGISSTGYGVHGESGGYAVYGNTVSGNGIHGNASDAGAGVVGVSYNGSGVVGTSTNSLGLNGSSTNDTGVYGYTGNPDNASAGYFEGPLNATTKNFRIDHPLDPAHKVLTHSCVESNERKLVYDGIVTTDAAGHATVELPAYFDALNTDLRYQLTVIGGFAQAIVKSKVAQGRFVIATSEPGIEVSWQVTGVRQDAYAKAHPLVVESPKRGLERGRYLNPVEHGQPERDGLGYLYRAAGHVPTNA